MMRYVTVTLPTEGYCKFIIFVLFPLISYTQVSLLHKVLHVGKLKAEVVRRPVERIVAHADCEYESRCQLRVR
jgi:hypothetical protein